ncbi:AT-rich interactive domain-containing protein 3A [Nematolebias whitei]|uniref:AT-rich interactive domain-containing protein 3A n=1 Tax=Nematolebias whitei TaxID=451745 RepID=UPI00189B840A|nr:AT-rich interactive domain-containing protein 3A [Nematolebias whitei]
MSLQQDRAPAASTFFRPQSHQSGSQSHQSGPGGMKLEAVMESLQRQQAARLALEEHLWTESGIHHQGACSTPDPAGGGSRTGVPLPPLEDGGSRLSKSGTEDKNRSEEGHKLDVTDDEEDEDEDIGSNRVQHRQSGLRGSGPPSQDSTGHFMARVPGSRVPGFRVPGFRVPESRVQESRVQESVEPASSESPCHHEWTYEEQFKQLYELDDDEKRKEFLDDLFSFMQKRGTPVNRIPIMAKQVLDLYMLYKLVTEKGGLVEVINKKIWREITKGLNLPTSITSAAFTLRTQYMKYLYPYECEKRGLSSPGELQAAIDSNRREGRRQNYGSVIFNYSPTGTPNILSSPKIQSHLQMLTHNSGHFSQSPMIKKEGPGMGSCLPSRTALPLSPGDHHQATVTQSSALEHIRQKLEISEPPQKIMIIAEEQQRIMEHTLQNLRTMASQPPLNIKVNNKGDTLRDDRQEATLNLSTNGISSINMSIEINGVVYTGILFAQQSAVDGMMEHRGKHSYCKTQGKNTATYFEPSCSSLASSLSSLHGHKNSFP